MARSKTFWLEILGSAPNLERWMDYEQFLKNKVATTPTYGFEVAESEINPMLKPHQKASVIWGVRGGRRAWFEAFGLGKTFIQLEAVRITRERAGGRGLIVLPLGVRQEFVRDAQKLDIPVKFIRRIEEAEDPAGIYLTNYESVRDGKLDPREFSVASLDEASCFPEDTMVETPKGLVAIKALNVGDQIINASGVDNVRDKFKTEVKVAVKVKTASKTIISSPGHLFFTTGGWMAASKLQPGDAIVETQAAMRMVRRRNSSTYLPGSQEALLRSVLLSEMEEFPTGNYFQDETNEVEEPNCQGESKCKMATAENVRVVRKDLLLEVQFGDKQKILQQQMLCQVADEPTLPEKNYFPSLSHSGGTEEAQQEHQSVVEFWNGKCAERKEKDWCAEPYGKQEESREDGRDTSKDWSPSPVEWRKREGLNVASVYTAPLPRGKMGGRISHTNITKEAGSADLPLFGSCKSGEEDRHRGGRRNTQANYLERERRKENQLSDFDRVEGIEVLEPGHPELEQYRDANGRIYFYDLTATQHPSFSVENLLVHNCLRGFGGTKTFREFMRLFAGDGKTLNERIRSNGVRYRYVATATPSPNDYIELLAYAAYLDIMEVSQAKTRFFKRNSTKADQLTLHPHKEEEFWLWVSSWALFVQRPSDLGFDDTGYALPRMTVRWHQVPSNHADAGKERNGQMRLFANAAIGVQDAAREKRNSLSARVAKTKEIIEAEPGERFILWHDLEAERHALQKAIPEAVSVWGTQDLDEREERIIGFSDGQYRLLSTKPIIAGSGCNFQRHCHRAIFTGIGFKFNDFIQAIHRIHRFLQDRPVAIDIIYTEAEKLIRKQLERKWAQHNRMVTKMTEIIKEYGLSLRAMGEHLTRAMGVERVEASGERYRVVNNDCVIETRQMDADSVGLILTSIPFSSQYEYSPNYADFGHSDNNAHFWQQMDFLIPELLRVLQPGRLAAIHVKDRIVPGGMTGLGFQTVYPFHADCIAHFARHGFGYMGMKTIVTDVVRENNQTYRLGWTEQCKDGSKMGFGMPEYLLLFRKPPTDTSNGYADDPIVKSKEAYSRGRWQVDAHGFTRSNGDRFLTPEELESLPHEQIFKLFRQFSLSQVYDFEHHVKVAEHLDIKGRLPVTFMLLQPQSWHPDVWTDITRMLTLNTKQARKGAQMHLCLARDSLILTKERGYVPIQDVCVGEHSLTHKGRWRRVLKVKNTGIRKVITIKAQGVPGLTLTGDHELWVRKSNWARERDGAERSEPKWVEAKDSLGGYVNQKAPICDTHFNEDKTLWWIVGRWLADGHIDARGSAIISCGKDKWEHFLTKIGGFGGNKPRVGTAIQLQLRDPERKLRSILDNCGTGAKGKHLPPESFTLPTEQSRALLDGYLSGDGHFLQARNRWMATSCSRELLMGLSFIVQRVHGSVASIHAGRGEREHVIEGRTVHASQEWQISFDVPNGGRKKPFVLDDGAWKKVRSIEDAGEIETWCLKVDEDESFTAEGCIVKNCPLQFDLVDRAIEQWSMPGETIYDPFGGLMTVPYRAILKGRYGVGCELSERYWFDGVAYCRAAEEEVLMPTVSSVGRQLNLFQEAVNQ